MTVYEKGLVFGCYDPLHHGHEALFARCKKVCQHLTVCAHSDDYIREWKHREPHRPESTRVKDVFNCDDVDDVALNEGHDRAAWARELGVDVVFLSAEVAPKRMGIPADIKVIHMPRTPGVSSTALRAGVSDDA